MRDGDVAREEPDLHIDDSQPAVTEDNGMRRCELPFDLTSSFPPPPDDIHHITIVGEQGRVRLGVVAIPRVG